MNQLSFDTRQHLFTQTEQTAQQRYNRLSIARLVWFLATAGSVWICIHLDYISLGLGLLVVGTGVFLALLSWHQSIRRQRDTAHYLAFINDDEARRLNRQYLRDDTGAAFAQANHPYTGDLDIFGSASLFRLLNRTHTHEGTRRLADWLRHPAPPETIRFRQQAVAELLPQLDWRQEIEAAAYLTDGVGQATDALLAWATQSQPALSGWLRIIRWVLPLFTLVLIGLYLLGLLPGWAVILSLLGHGVVLSRTSELAQAVSEQTFATVRAVGAYQALFRYVEQLAPQSVLLRQIKRHLTSEQKPASVAVGALRQLTEGLNYRRNPYFYLLVGVLTLWDVHYLIRLDGWRTRYGNRLPAWLDALADVESLNSLAGFAYAHPTYATPTIANDGLHLDAGAVAHPLIPPNRAVANSITLAGHGQTVLITGSNMSGKSTFLRTIGINLVLALAGGVVSAERFGCSPMRLFTSMRTQDSLEESTSSFYAELKRLQTLIQLTQPNADSALPPMLYFLDEILKGTNSADRHRGAEALIRQLHCTSASGFVSTHDLELGQMGHTVDYVTNYHFQSDVIAGELHFDYRLRPGICQSFNASQLMQAIGIQL